MSSEDKTVRDISEIPLKWQGAEAQIELEALYHKNEKMPALRRHVMTEEFCQEVERFNLPLDFCVDLVAQMMVLIRFEPSAVIGMLYHHFMPTDADPADYDTVGKAMEKCAEVLMHCVDADFVDLSEDGKLEAVFEPEPKVQRQIDLYQFPLPMIVNPQYPGHRGENRGIGYLTQGGSVITGKGNHHEDDVCLDHLHRVNQIPLKLNMETARLVKLQWKNLEKPKEGEPLKDYRDRVKAFKKFEKNTWEVMEMLHVMADQFWLCHRYDKRGRCYTQGYHVNFQGCDYQKAIVEFSEGEMVNG